MKPVSHVIIFVLVISTSMAVARAQSPREQLTQMVEQLQKTPTDNVLRERIIKLAREIKPALAIPDEAIRLEGRAQFAFKSAKSAGDFLAAAREYEGATAVAPWVPGYYSDLCTIYEKAGIYIEAKRNCEMYLSGVLGVSDVTEAKRRIAGLEFAIDKFSKANLSVRDQPFRTDIAELLAGKRWFCGGYYNEGAGKRAEEWVTYDGSTATRLYVDWFDAQTLAKFYRGGVRMANGELVTKNPAVDVKRLKRDPAAPNVFHEMWVVNGVPGKAGTFEIGADGETAVYTTLLEQRCKRIP